MGNSGLMASRSESDTPRKRVFENGESVRCASVVTNIGDTSEEERFDGQKGLTLVTTDIEREVTGEPLDLSDIQRVQMNVTRDSFWEMVDELTSQTQKRKPERGRKRKHNVADWMVFWAAKSVYGGSARKTARQLQDPQNWWLISNAVKQRWPNDKNRRLSSRPITRSQYHYFRENYIDDETIERLSGINEDCSAKSALHIGLFDPKAGSMTHPNKSQGIAGDATWQETMTGVHEPTERNRDKYDPDAVYYHTSEDRPTRGHKLVLSVSHNGHRQESVILAFDVKSKSITEAELFFEQVNRLIRNNPQIQFGLHFVAYDMALDSATQDCFLDIGINPVSKVRRTKGGNPAAVSLGTHKFKMNGKVVLNQNVIAVDGASCVVFTDAEGDDRYVPLRLREVLVRPQATRILIYAVMELPDDPAVPENLVGARTEIRMNSTPEEIEANPHQRRTRAARLFAEGVAEQFQVFGIREFSETCFSLYKSDKPEQRAQVTDARRLKLELMAHQFTVSNIAVVANHNRTGKDITRFFGNRNPLNPPFPFPSPGELEPDEPIPKAA